MDLRIITVRELRILVEDAAFASLQNIPITPLRAFSQQLNPHADADDPALVIAYDEAGQILAYFGCLPDRLRKNSSSGALETPDEFYFSKTDSDLKYGLHLKSNPNSSDDSKSDEGITEKCCWSSCWWVHPAKGQAAAMPVFYKALQVWNAKMLFDALPERSEAVLDKMGYFSFRKIAGIHSFLRFKFHKIIPAKIPFLAPLKNVFYVLDTLLNIPVQMRLGVLKRKYKVIDGTTITRIKSIDEETEHFIQFLSQNEFLQRNKETFNWIIQNPWLSSNKEFTKKYFFSSYANHFENTLLKIHQDNKMIAFLWLTLRDGTAKLPYCYITPGHEETAANILNKQLIENPVDTFICFQQNLLPVLEKMPLPFLHQKKVSKTFGWTKTLDTFFADDFYLQDGDGDGVFT